MGVVAGTVSGSKGVYATAHHGAPSPFPTGERVEGIYASTVRDNWFGPASLVPRAINGNQTQLILIASDDH